jgi:hypothetical protein
MDDVLLHCWTGVETQKIVLYFFSMDFLLASGVTNLFQLVVLILHSDAHTLY